MPERELEPKIAAWRRKLTAELGGRDDIADELESHLRDGIEVLRKTGVPPEEAFARTLARLGDLRAAAEEFARLPQPWWGGAGSPGARALAYLSGTLSLAGLVFWLRFSFLGFVRLLGGRGFPADPGWPVFLQTMGVALAATSWFALGASRRFLERPSARDLRGVIAFNLLAFWMATGMAVEMLHASYATKVTALGAALGLIGAAWSRSVAGKSSTPETTR